MPPIYEGLSLPALPCISAPIVAVSGFSELDSTTGNDKGTVHFYVNNPSITCPVFGIVVSQVQLETSKR